MLVRLNAEGLTGFRIALLYEINVGHHRRSAYRRIALICQVNLDPAR